LQHLGHPIVADRLYGGGARLSLADLDHSSKHNAEPREPIEDAETDADASSVLIARQALHARRLAFRHPHSGKELEFEAPLPDDVARTIAALARHCPLPDRKS
jgi:23S rRNA pseudouridine1911/1915/1917 synthase